MASAKLILVTLLGLLTHAWQTATDAPGQIDAFRTKDLHGCNWTTWFDRDNPTDNGDFEDLKSLNREHGVCSNPTGIQCETVTGIPHNQTGEVVTCTLPIGCVCKNADQPDGACQDYRVKFCCP